MKKWIIRQVILVLVVFAVGQIAKAFFFYDQGLQDLRTVDDAYNVDCDLQFILGKDAKDGDEWYDFIKELWEEYEKNPDQFENIVVVKATGKFKQYPGYCLQEVEIKKVLKGNCVVEGKIYDVRDANGFVIYEDQNVMYDGHMNIMDKDSDYLIMFETNKWEKMKKPILYVKDSFFGILNISKDDHSIIEKKLEDLKYSDVKDREIFVGSQKVLDEFLRVKHKLIEMYLK